MFGRCVIANLAQDPTNLTEDKNEKNSRFQQTTRLMNWARNAHKLYMQWFTDHASTSQDSPQMRNNKKTINRAEYYVLL